MPAVELGQDLIAAGKHRFFVIRNRITEEQAETLRRSRVTGVGVFEEPYRTYPLGSLASQVLGFASSDGRGLAGIENQCDEWLRGDTGVKTIVCDAARRAFWLADEGYQPPRDGYHVVLTIDAVIQATAEGELRSAVAKYRAESGVAIVMDPRNGAILASQTSPTSTPIISRTIPATRSGVSATVPSPIPSSPAAPLSPSSRPGPLSIRSPISATSSTAKACGWVNGKHVLHDHKAYSSLSFEDVLARSSNIGMGKLGKRSGNGSASGAALKAFGFGEKTGVDIAGESPGLVPAPTNGPASRPPAFRWATKSPSPRSRSFALLAFANGGMLVQPHVIRAVVASDGGIVREFKEPSKRRAIPRAIAETMKNQILSGVVNHGTGSGAALTKYQVFGKTGTAQIPKSGSPGYIPDAYMGSFIGAAPSDEPRLVVLVCITRPLKSLGYYGGTVAAPAAREILAASLAYLQVPPEREAPVELAGVPAD